MKKEYDENLLKIILYLLIYNCPFIRKVQISAKVKPYLLEMGNTATK